MSESVTWLKPYNSSIHIFKNIYQIYFSIKVSKMNYEGIPRLLGNKSAHSSRNTSTVIVVHVTKTCPLTLLESRSVGCFMLQGS